MPRKGEDADPRRAQGDSAVTDRQTPQEPAGEPRAENRPAAESRPAGRRADVRSGLGALFASAALRWGLAVAGFVLFLFAIGQAVGLDLLGMFAEALSTETGRWLLVAVFALFLIGVARRGIVRTFRA
ncbi:hypothetical protein [Halopelagius longus]|uniref:Uncharacterized protein n=1 Tax=Halopelagius longus TaxID=1236180 RepID=A0A1H0YB18_9EURY|nr:hypothetical protein [Halopelagius longus]RDI72389.1 hypothetical protein DWB78_12065 [Halopelagius longus]SDQ12394.1 hypothetical protein SAMN05216278_0526 [Halopelagius longus]